MQETITMGFIGFAVLLIVLSLPLMFNKVKPNWLYGLRTPTTVNNPEVWYAINRYTAKQMIGLSVILIAVALALYFYGGLSNNLLIGINTTLAVIGIVYITVNGIIKARGLAAK